MLIIDNLGWVLKIHSSYNNEYKEALRHALQEDVDVSAYFVVEMSYA